MLHKTHGLCSPLKLFFSADPATGWLKLAGISGPSDLDEVSVSPFLQPVGIPLNGTTTLWCISPPLPPPPVWCHQQICGGCRCPCPIICSINEGERGSDPILNPGSHCSNQDLCHWPSPPSLSGDPAGVSNSLWGSCEKSCNYFPSAAGFCDFSPHLYNYPVYVLCQ